MGGVREEMGRKKAREKGKGGRSCLNDLTSLQSI
jgi:hypothetical protein